MDAFFFKLLDMSLSAGFVVLVVLLLRLVLRKAPKWLSCALWALVAVRLVCPFSLESNLSLMPEREVIQAQTGEIVALYSAPVSASEPKEAAESYAYYDAPASDGTRQVIGPVPVEEPPAIHWLGIGSIVWAVGMAALLSYAAVSYLRLRKKVSASVDIGNGVYICDYIDSPFILGIGKPKIYLSSAMEPADAAHVLAHERAHLKRKDHWWKPFGFALLAVHWFNPLICVAYVLLCRDIELACDERVVKDMALTDKKAYSEALLKCSVPRHMIVACPLAFGEVGVRERVKSVLSYQKPAFWVVLMAVVVCLIAGVCFLTDPVSPEKPHDETTVDTSAVDDLDVLKDFDWDTVKQEIGADEFTLFDPLFYGSYLFIGCQNADDYSILCFEKAPTGSYELNQVKSVLQPYLYSPNSSPKRPALLTAYCETEESELGLFVITDETMTGIETYSGSWNYYRIDHWPALVVMNKSDWGIYDDYGFEVRYGSPAKVAFTLGENGDTLKFRKTDIGSADCQYLYRSSVLFDDGFHMPGSYDLEESELTQLVLLLTQLPENAFVPCEKPDEQLHQVDVYIGLDDGRIMDTRETLLTFRYRENSVILGISNRDSNGESSYTSDSPWQYFRTTDPQLCAFLLSLCDNDRKQATMIVYNEPRFIEYSYGEACIRLFSIKGWEYEIVEYRDENTPFGIRARPNGYDEGWIFYSFWPGGFTVEDGYGQATGVIYGDNRKVWYPKAELEKKNYRDQIWAYLDYTDTIGDYVVVNEGADAWVLEYDRYLDYAFGPQIAYTQCFDPIKGPENRFFGASPRNQLGFQLRDGWLSGIWDNDAIPYPHMYRFWPEGQTEGFISIAFLEDGFTPEEALTVEEITLSEPIRPFPAFTATEAGAEHWRYLWIDVEGGSYLLRNDNADHWTQEQWEQAMEMIDNIVIGQYDVP